MSRVLWSTRIISRCSCQNPVHVSIAHNSLQLPDVCHIPDCVWTKDPDTPRRYRSSEHKSRWMYARSDAFTQVATDISP